MAAPQGAHRVLGLCEGREARQRRADRRKVPGHPPRPRLPGLPGPHGQARAVRAARRAGDRHGPDRILRDDAGYIGHPAASYFAIPKIGRDQLEDWAARKAMPLAEAERWLAPLL
jgi:hypothetical protein